MAVESGRIWSRRELIAGGVVAGAGAMLHTDWSFAAAELPLITRPIPSSGERLPVIGIGTNAFGVTAANELADRRQVLEALPRLGGKVVDTARMYGSSEEVIGRLLAELGNRDKLFVATKTLDRTDFSRGKAVLDESFTRLGVAKIDLLQFHNLGGVEQLMPHYLEYKKAGKIRYIGATTASDGDYPRLLAAMGKYPFDFIQVDYSIDNRDSAQQILPLAREKGMAVIQNVPFGGRRGPVFPRLAGKVVPEWAKEFDATTWAQFMLKYNISHPATTVVIPGTTRLATLQDNQMGARGRVPDAALRLKMEQHWSTL